MYQYENVKAPERNQRGSDAVRRTPKASVIPTSSRYVSDINTAQMKPSGGNIEDPREKLSERFDYHRKYNNTGLPDNLKNGVEALSGYSLDDVKVHFNSSKPAQLHAYAYTIGADIHVAPGQERHLPHEAWHVVQQKQGRVRPMYKKNGVNINDNPSLEREADINGRLALNSSAAAGGFADADISEEVAQLDIIELNNPINAPGQHDRIIGINLMPSKQGRDHASDYIPFIGKAWETLSDKFAGHSSIISGNMTRENDIPELQLEQGKGFAPKGMLNSLKVGWASIFGKQVDVPGEYKDESQAILMDKKARQVIVHVSEETYQKWNQIIGNGGNGVVVGGIYSFAPGTGMNNLFDGPGSDNCTTIALRNTRNACISLLYDLNAKDPKTPVDLKDITALERLQEHAKELMNYIVEQNNKKMTPKGTQGRAMYKLEEMYHQGGIFFTPEDIDLFDRRERYTTAI